MATYSMIFTYSHIHHIYVYNIYPLYHIYVYRHTDYFKIFNIINNTAINSPVYKYPCIFHCFLQVNPHIYFSSPSLQFLVIINHWLKITGVFPFYYFPCSHFPNLPFLSFPHRHVLQVPQGQCLLWASHLAVLPGLFHSTDQDPASVLVWSHGQYQPGLP